MNALLWVLQVALALLYFAGGAYKTFMFDELTNQIDAIPRAGWGALGVLEMVCAVLLVLPVSEKWMPIQTRVGGGGGAVETLALAALYAGYSLTLTAANPLVWALAMGLMAAFVAYGRYALRPTA
jgi:hypothetical protein